MKFLFLILFLCLISCGIFEPRDHNPPTEYSNRDFYEYEDVLLELYETYTKNLPERINNLLPEDDSSFIFSAPYEDDFINISNKWYKQTEIDITNMILENDSLIKLEYDENINVISVDSVVVIWDYNIMLLDSTSIKGQSHFTIQRKISRYYLTNWLDYADTSSEKTFKSWGKWKMQALSGYNE